MTPADAAAPSFLRVPDYKAGQFSVVSPGNFGYNGTGDTVTVGGTGNSFLAYGGSTTIDSTGTGNLVTDIATGGANTITLGGSNSTATITNTAADTLTLGGSGNTINVEDAMTAAGTATISGTGATLEFGGATSEDRKSVV